MTEKIAFLIQTLQEKLSLGQTLLEAQRALRAVATEEEISAAVESIREQRTHRSKLESSLLLAEDESRSDWYSGESNDPLSHWRLLVETLKNKRSRPWDDDMVGALNRSSNMVVSQLVPPRSKVSLVKKGLVLGYVQSGKTANFSAVIAKAVDAGYKLIIVLSGVHNVLRMQTQSRLYEELVAPKESACTTLTKVDEKGDFQKSQSVTANRALGSKDGFTLVVLKKNSSVLRTFRSWLEESSGAVRDACPALIVDDESDQASVNTGGPEDDPSAINNHIRNLLKLFSVATYVGYTATPFANVLIDAQLDDDLYPRDFLVALEKPIGYVGPEELFGRDKIEPAGALQGLPVTRHIPPGDALSATDGKRNQKLPSSLLKAVDSFLLAAACRLARGQWKQHISMLIHTSHLVSKHSELKDSIDDLVLTLKLDCEEESTELQERLKELFVADFTEVSKKFSPDSIHSFDAVWRNVKKVLEKIEVVMENHVSEERLTFARTEPFWGIVIGGNTLSRGLTIEGLTVSYFLRGPKAYDTLLQMGRWFGYRPNYVDLTRIFVTEDMERKFFHLATVEQEVREEIRAMAANEERPIDVGLKIRTHPGMTVTSNLKMRSAQSCYLTYSAAKIQILHVNLRDKLLLEHNWKVVIDLLDKCESYSRRQFSKFENFSNCILYRNLSPELILQFLDEHKFSEANIRFSRKLASDYITDMIKRQELTSWSVAVMSPKSGKQIDLGRGRKVFKVDRSIVRLSRSERDKDAEHIKVITAPGDELIDLDDLLASADVSNTDTLFDQSPQKTELYYRQSVRPLDRGLLLLHALNPEREAPEGPHNDSGLTAPLTAARDLFGVTFVFPKSPSAKSSYKYLVNGSI